MRKFVKAYVERLWLGLAFLSFASSLGWFWNKQSEVRRIKAQPVVMRLVKSDYIVAKTTSPVAGHEPWSKPAPQSTGGGWIYELFTPPVVFYNPRLSVFSVEMASDSVKEGPALNLELIAVRRELFRLQIGGYFGEQGSYTVAFTQPGRPETLLAREGEPLGNSGLQLRRFSVQRMPLHDNDGFELAALAELSDGKSGDVIILDSRTQKFCDPPLATIRISHPQGVAREVREGDVIEDEIYTYKISRIRDVPAEVQIILGKPGLPDVETKTLYPAIRGLEEASLDPNDSIPILSRPATGLVTNAR